MSVKPHFLLSLGGHSKEAGDEGGLPQNVPFFHATHLPFPHHVHDLIALQGSPRRLERKETQPWFDASFDEAMILFDDVVEVLDLPQFTGVWNGSFRSSMDVPLLAHQDQIGLTLPDHRTFCNRASCSTWKRRQIVAKW